MPNRGVYETDDDAFATILERASVSSVFQPVVDLDTGQVAGFEALARGPVGSLHQPAALFGAARRIGQLSELDWLCRTSAVTGARQAGLRAPLSLLVNAEPETLLADQADPSRWGEFADLRCYCEVTERALARTPGRLAAALDQIRAQDWGVALDDVGVEPASLALMPLLQPDLIKLDMSLLHTDPSEPGDVRVARVIDAALAQAAATGAAVIAEGIENERHLERARAYGVKYGQGYLLGRPGPLPEPLPEPRISMPLLPRMLDRVVNPAPFSVVANVTPVRALTPPAVFELVRQLLAQAAKLVPPPAVLISSPDPLPTTLQTMVDAMLDGTVAIPLVGVLGAAQTATPLPPDDPASNDLAVAVVTARYAAAVVARPTLGAGSNLDAALVVDRQLALAVANTLLTRL